MDVIFARVFAGVGGFVRWLFTRPAMIGLVLLLGLAGMLGHSTSTAAALTENQARSMEDACVAAIVTEQEAWGHYEYVRTVGFTPMRQEADGTWKSSVSVAFVDTRSQFESNQRGVTRICRATVDGSSVDVLSIH